MDPAYSRASNALEKLTNAFSVLQFFNICLLAVPTWLITAHASAQKYGNAPLPPDFLPIFPAFIRPYEIASWIA